MCAAGTEQTGESANVPLLQISALPIQYETGLAAGLSYTSGRKAYTHLHTDSKCQSYQINHYLFQLWLGPSLT